MWLTWPTIVVSDNSACVLTLSGQASGELLQSPRRHMNRAAKLRLSPYYSWSSWWGLPYVNYTKKVIYCGTRNNVFLPVYITTIIHIKNQNKVVAFLVAWLFTMPHVWKMFLSIMINHCWRELWPNTIEWDHWSWCSLWWYIFTTHSCKSSVSNTFSKISLAWHMSSYNYKAWRQL
jgi:hypothetical protein